MDYNIDPYPGSTVSSPVWEWHYQFLFIDYSNSQVIMPILSNYRSGFYYLRVQTSPACMIYPPISSCLSTGLPPTKTFDLLNKVYPHTCYGPYQAIQRATTIGNNIFTMSSCQLQSRSFPNPNLSMTPAGVINFWFPINHLSKHFLIIFFIRSPDLFDQLGWIISTLPCQMDKISSIRRKIPILTHQKPSSLSMETLHPISGGTSSSSIFDPLAIESSPSTLEDSESPPTISPAATLEIGLRMWLNCANISRLRRQCWLGGVSVGRLLRKWLSLPQNLWQNKFWPVRYPLSAKIPLTRQENRQKLWNRLWKYLL